MDFEVNEESPARVTRRALLAALATLSLPAKPASALGRRRYGGTLRLAVPWGIARLDPHELSDAIAALFASAISDPLFALDASGRAYPALARTLPEPIAGGARIRLRAGLLTARNRALSAGDVRESLERAAHHDALALLAEVRGFRPVRGDPLALDLVGADAATLATRLANPLTAILPRGYSPLDPDGTGAFAARLFNNQLLLTRNINAARGPALLDAIEIGTFNDLADGLRAFESGSVDVGWLGSGLHHPRGGSVPFVGSTYGWAVLRTGRSSGGWGAPGVAQQLVNGVEPERLRHLGLEALPASAVANNGWSGGPAPIVVADDAPQLLLIARALGAALGRSGHELSVEAVPRAELARQRRQGDYKLMLDFARRVGPDGPATQLALLSAENPELAKRPPRIESFDARSIARGLSLGVVGELWVSGAHAAAFQGLAGWQLGDVWQKAAAAS
jgi:peptide/nickel transport system substrate-binding protein